MAKVKFVVDFEFDLEKFKKEFEERNFKKNWTWEDELKSLFEANLEGFCEDLFCEYDIEEMDWNIKIVEIAEKKDGSQ